MSKDIQHMQLAKAVADIYSKDRSTKVGCVFIGKYNEVLSIGYNGFVRGVDDNEDSRHERPEKYFWSEHSERNAIFNAARIGISLKDASVYITSLPPCVDCARSLVQVGVKRIILEQKAFNNERTDFWSKEWGKISSMFKETKIEVVILDEEKRKSENETT